jgi:hypothetical protein
LANARTARRVVTKCPSPRIAASLTTLPTRSRQGPCNRTCKTYHERTVTDNLAGVSLDATLEDLARNAGILGRLARDIEERRLRPESGE